MTLANSTGELPTFAEFLDMAIMESPIEPVKPDHILPMTYYLCDGHHESLANFVGHFETLDEDWACLLKLLGVKFVALAHDNKSNHLPWQEAYSSAQLKMVERHYAGDYLTFGYPYGVP